MRQYYYLAISLPKLEIGRVPDIDLPELETLLKENLTPSDMEYVVRLRKFYDVLNIRAYWTGTPFDYWGNLDAAELEEELLTQEFGVFPLLLGDYLKEHESREERLKHFPQLLKKYFEAAVKESTGFMKRYLKFERDLRLTLVGFRARKLNRNLSAELQYEDPEEDIIAQLLAQKDAKNFEPPLEFEDLKLILDKYYNEPLELNKALTQYRFNKVEERFANDPFSIDRVLGYIVQYMLVDKWLHYDQEKGMEIIKQIEQETS